MYGAILGDMIGAPYEFDRGGKTKIFPLFSRESRFTDDSVMTVAVAESLIDAKGKSDEELRTALIASMQKWGRRYPDAGYGGMFKRWLRADDPQPYGSYGNGSAMRVSPAGWLYKTLEETRRIARMTAEVTHNHPEGIKGAEATASAIFLARKGRDKDEIREYITAEFGYDLTRTIDEIRPGYHHVESCQETVPEAITAFLEGEDFEDVIRTAVSLGGDCDTLTCIAGGIAEAFYGVPEELENECRARLPEDILSVLDRFMTRRSLRGNTFLDGNELIEEAIAGYTADPSEKCLAAVIEAIRERMHKDGHFIIPVISSEDGADFSFRSIRLKNGTEWQVVFTTAEEYEKGEESEIISFFIDATLKACADNDSPGYIVNPWGQPFFITKELINEIFAADGDTEYHVPDDELTPELLDGGAYLKRAIGICNRNMTNLNLFKLMKILRESYVWIPCSAVFSDSDNERFAKRIEEAQKNGGIEQLIGTSFTNEDQIRMVPDILQSGESFFFPVFTSNEEMGEYGKSFSHIERHFLEAVSLARNNDKNVEGIVINAFTEPFTVGKELFGLIEEMSN